MIIDAFIIKSSYFHYQKKNIVNKNNNLEIIPTFFSKKKPIVQMELSVSTDMKYLIISKFSMRLKHID